MWLFFKIQNLNFAPQFLISPNLSVTICGVPFEDCLLSYFGVWYAPREENGAGIIEAPFWISINNSWSSSPVPPEVLGRTLTSGEGLFKVSPSLLWNAQWIGGQLEVNTSSSSSSFCELPGCSSSRGSEKRDCTPTGCLAGRWRVFWNANLQSWGLETCLLFRVTVTQTGEK